MSRSITASDANGATFDTVSSNSGFSAGDLVYYGPTGYDKILTAAVPSTSTSTPTKPYPSLPRLGTSGGYFQSSDLIGLGYSRSLATLSNGNVVAVYANQADGFPYFVVFNPTTRAVVAGPTTISSTFTMTAANNTGGTNIGVAAFAGGNFVVFWGNNAGGTTSRVNYAIYTNAGASVVAATQDTTLAINNTNSGCMRGVTLPNGGFVLAFGNANNVNVRAYDAAGVGQFAWVTLSGFASSATSANNPSWGLAARSDNTYLLAGQSTSGTQYNYAIYNYAGAAVVATTTFNITAGTSNGKLDCATLSDGTTFVIAYAGAISASDNMGWNFRFLPTGNTLSAPFFVAGTFNGLNGTTASSNYVRVWPLSSNRFLITGADQDSYGAYAVFNSSGTPLLGITGSTGTGSATRGYGSYFPVGGPVLGVIESGGNAEVYAHTSLSSNYPSPPYFRIDLTTYNMVSATTTSGSTVVPVSLTPISAYAPATSTPSKASFALSNGVFPYSLRGVSTASAVAAGVYPDSLNVLNNVSSFDMCVLSNGNICVVSTSTSTGAVTAQIFNPVTLVRIGTSAITAAGPAISGSLTSNPTVRITPLDGGNFCVACGTSATNMRLTVWDSNFAQVGSTVDVTTFTLSYGSQTQSFALATISGNRVVVVYNNTNTSIVYAVYSSTLSLTAGPSVVLTDGTSLSTSAVSATPDGFTVCTARGSANAYVVVTYFEFTPNVFSQPSYATGTVDNNSGVRETPPYLVTNNNGQLFASYATSGPGYRTNVIYANTGGAIIDIPLANATTMGAVTGITAAGLPFLIYQDSVSYVIGIATPGMANVTFPTWQSTQTRFGTQQLKSVPLYGNMVLIAYATLTSNRLVFSTVRINGYPDSAVFTTADATLPAPIYPQTTTSTAPAVTGLTLAGVAVTDCAAGGTGVIQTTGATNLNSSYPTTTAQTFDYTGQAAPGVKGTISGRSISMRKS